MKTTLLAVGFLFVATSALAQTWTKEPASFLGVPFGASEADVEATTSVGKKRTREPLESGMGARCLVWRGGKERECRYLVPLKTDPTVELEVFFELHEGRFHSARTTFNSGLFDFMKAVLVHRYGPPSKTEMIPMQTAGGAEFLSERVTWDGAERYIVLNQFAFGRENSALRIGSKTVDRAKAEREAQMVRATAEIF